MLIFILIYLGIGAAIMAFVILRTPYDNEPDVMVKMMARIDYSDTSNLYENILIKFLVPLTVCPIIVVAWPLLLVWKAWDSWKVRHIRTREADAKSTNSVRTEKKSVPIQVKATKFTNEEWAATKVLKLLAKAQGESKVSDV